MAEQVAGRPGTKVAQTGAITTSGRKLDLDLEDMMSSKKFGLLLVLGAFLALHAYGLSHDGIEGFLAIFRTTNGWHMVLGADLTISLTLAAVWLVKDAKRRGVSSLPYVLLTIATGSAGPLLYLIRRREA